MSSDLEQHFILRVPNPDLANKLRGWLRDQTSIDGRISLAFEQGLLCPNIGVLTIDDVQHTVVLQDLPTVVESYKTLDDANLVKVADIGQVLLVVDPTIGMPTTIESQDGVTPPMRKARSRHFKPSITLPEVHMKDAVNDVVEMLCGRAPQGYEFHDIEEEYVVDPATGEGRWQQVRPSKLRTAAAAAAGASEAAAGRQQRAKRRGKAAGSDDEDDMIDDMTESD